MSRSLQTRVVLLLLATSLAASVAACSRKGQLLSGTHSASRDSEPVFQPNNVLDDSSMTDVTMTADDVQKFLDKTPYSTASALATYQPAKTKTAAQIIAAAASKYGVNPMLLLVRVQLETELVSKTTATPTELDRAFACGCASTSSSTVCTPTADARGFENQAMCAGSQLRTALDRLDGKGKIAKSANVTTDGTAKGWAVNKPQKTRDGIEVTPENAATAVLYAYKPWVGKLGKGDPSIGGMSAYWTLWNDFTRAPDPAVTNDPASDGDGGFVSSGSPDNPDNADPSGGCRVVRGVDSCGSGSQCDRRDGLAGQCIKADCSSQCTGSATCDPTSNPPRCVQCTSNDLTNCGAENEGNACIEGRCGCVVSADCGFGRGRICNRLQGVCVDAPANYDPQNPQNPQDPQNPQNPQNPNPTPTDPDAGTPTTPDDSTAGTPADTTPADAPAAATPDIPSSSGSGDGGRPADDKIDVPGSDSGGCTTAASGPSPAGPWTEAFAFGLALAAALRRRRRAATA